MSATLVAARPARHPWLAQFAADPDGGYADLIAGYADIHPYERADAPDAARLLFGPLAEDDPARGQLDAAVLAWLEACRRSAMPDTPAAHQRRARQLCETLEIVYLLDLPRTAVALRRRRLVWEDFCARHMLGTALDARAMLWRAMALTQALVHATDPAVVAQGLAPLWQTLCREAGAALPQRYLALGLLGLRRLPEADGEMPWLAGLAQWALARQPSTAAFRAEWLALKPLYPRNPAQWRAQVARLLNTRQFASEGIEPPGWWGEADQDLRPRPAAPNQRPPERLRSPGPEACTAVIGRLDRPLGAVRPDIEALVAGHRRFREATGDPQFFSKMVHALGSALIDRAADAPTGRARLAEALAREALAWEPNDGFLWSVWHRALIAQARPDAAELLGWERLRRNPDQPDGYTQLALLLARQPQRRGEAAALLRETIERFPADVPARNQLAELLIAQDRAAEAAEVIAAAFAAGAVNAVSYTIRVRLHAHAGDVPAAIAALEDRLRHHPQDRSLLAFRTRLAAGQTLPWIAQGLDTPPPATADVPDADDTELARAMAFGRLRRQRFRYDHAGEPGIPPAHPASAEEQDGPAVAYARVLAQRTGASVDDTLPVFAVAFEAALRAEDRDRLERLAEQQPRLIALTWLARAMFGDAAAAARVDAWLTAPADRHAAPADRGLRAALLAVRTLRIPVADLIQQQRATVLRLVHDASEATLGDILLAA